MRQTFCYSLKMISLFYILSLHDVASDSHFVLGKFTLFVSVSPCYFLVITEEMSAMGGYWLLYPSVMDSHWIYSSFFL